MLIYCVIYRTDEKADPVNVFAIEATQGHALSWSHRQKSWSYTPGLAVRYLDHPDNVDRYDEVAREFAEAVAPVVTGGVELPDEAAIRMAFERRSAAGIS